MLLCLALSLAAQACGRPAGPPTDEELLEMFVKDVTGVVDTPMLGRCMRYVNLAELPLDVSVPHHNGVYREDRAEDFTKRFHTQMRRRFGGSELKLRGHRIELEGTDAKVNLRLTTSQGPIRADIGLRKLADGWRVRSVRAEPGL